MPIYPTPSNALRASTRHWAPAFAGVCAVALAAGLVGCSSTETDKPSIDSTEQFRQDFVAKTQANLDAIDVPGLAVAVVREDGRGWSHGFGHANLSTQKPMTAHSVMGVASVSKMVTATAAMQAVEAGVLDLDEDINTKLPFAVRNPLHPETPITLRQLLTHTSSIVDSDIYKTPAVFHFGGDHPQELGDFLESYLTPDGEHYAADGNFLPQEPGVQFSYSNVGYGLIGHLVESATGTSFDELTRTRIFEPLGMDDSGWTLRDTDSTTLQYGLKDGPLADLMVGETTGPWRAYTPYDAVTYPDGALRTSAHDFSRFMAAIMNGGALGDARILEPQTVTTMLTPQDLGESNAAVMAEEGIAAQGLGFVQLLLPGLGEGTTRVGHTGGDPGKIGVAYLDPTTKVSVLAFMNSDPAGEESAAVFFQTMESLQVNADQLIGE